MTAVQLRRAQEADRGAIVDVVGAVVREVYGHLLPELPPLEADWHLAHVAESGGAIVAVLLTKEDWIEDLWILPGYRNRGLGARLLAAAEAEIAARGFAEARLRVVAENTRAQRFYRAHGWCEARTYPSERFGFLMIDFVKPLG